MEDLHRRFQRTQTTKFIFSQSEQLSPFEAMIVGWISSGEGYFLYGHGITQSSLWYILALRLNQHIR
jgi:hypothetical protein